MMNSKIVTLELEVEVEWQEDSHGTKQFVSAMCHSLCPITVQAWAEHAAWMRLNRKDKP